jgi:hypothetical protein
MIASPPPPAPPAIEAAAPVASATLEKCLAPTQESAGTVTFAAQMTTIPGTDEMAVRVRLQEHTPGSEGFHQVDAPGLGEWHESEPSVKVFRYLTQVTNLAAPASYRALVSFRWLDVGGHEIEHLARHTPVCRQPATRALARALKRN